MHVTSDWRTRTARGEKEGNAYVDSVFPGAILIDKELVREI